MGKASNEATRWIGFLRKYGPAAHNENMYDEFIQRSARRASVDPLLFPHPFQSQVLDAFNPTHDRTSIVLTGTAGDGKTFLCRQVWESLGGDPEEWFSQDPYLQKELAVGDPSGVRLHVIRDLSAWAPQHGREWDPSAESLLQLFSESIFDRSRRDIFLIAANDGQLVESWRRLGMTPAAQRALDLFEQLLVDDEQTRAGTCLQLFNLSRGSSAALFDSAVTAFLDHPGWPSCYDRQAESGTFFGPDCPIRRNYEILRTPLVRERIRALLALCDHNRLHIPIRQILLLLTNAVLGHPDVRDHLMNARDVPKLHADDLAGRASIYGNLFGANLPESRRETGSVFDYLDRFRIGQETSNRIDNTLIFGHVDETLREDFDRLVGGDAVYGASVDYQRAQRSYIDGGTEDGADVSEFLEAVMHQRRRLFFTIPPDQEEEYRLWDLTVFRYAGEYLDRVVGALKGDEPLGRLILLRLVRGLNRVFTGMLVTTERDLLLAVSPVLTHARVSRLLEERVSVDPRLGEKVEVVLERELPILVVSLGPDLSCKLPLFLTRYEFLSRVAEGVLPSSFSKECYEDILAFKSQLLAQIRIRRESSGEVQGDLTFRLLDVDENGTAAVVDLQVQRA